MPEPIERIWEKKLEAKLGQVVSKWEALMHTGSASCPQTDACLSTALCIVVAVAGFWFPVWCEYRFRDPDSRLGIVSAVAYPAIAFFVLRASASIRRVFQNKSRSNYRVALALTVILIGVCWLPLLFLTLRLIGIFFG
jgi:hypothetical protein